MYFLRRYTAFRGGKAAMEWTKMQKMLLFSAVLRFVLIIYGEWQDTHKEVRYTDLDCTVFSDAASLMASGASPYKRSTYRYSPLLALIPNSILHRSWGKFLFSASDLLFGLFIHHILKKRKVPEDLCLYSVMVWLLNPFTFTIGTRGNCEPIVSAMILWTILCLMNGKVIQAAFLYGLVVHFRIYPIIYGLPIVVALDPKIFQYGKTPLVLSWEPGRQSGPPVREGCGLWTLLQQIYTRQRILFGLISGMVFILFTSLFFYLYRWEFLNEALLYHLPRTDPRHNFSTYFYHIYLHYEHDFSLLEILVSFLPQLIVQLVLIFCFTLDLPFCLFLQTVAFVAFNKVITVWMGAQSHWLLWGYLLEFKGKNVFLQLWLASIMFLAANTFVAFMFIKYHRCCPMFKQIEDQTYKKIE